MSESDVKKCPTCWISRNLWHRIAVCALITRIIQAVFILLIFTLAHERPAPLWLYYVSYNIGLLIFPLGYGPILTGFYAMLTGIVSMFFIIYLIGEIINRLKKRRNES